MICNFQRILEIPSAGEESHKNCELFVTYQGFLIHRHCSGFQGASGRLVSDEFCGNSAGGNGREDLSEGEQ